MIEALIRLGRTVLQDQIRTRDPTADPPQNFNLDDSFATHLGLLAEQSYDLDSLKRAAEPNLPFITHLTFNVDPDEPEFVAVQPFRLMGPNDNAAVVFRGAVGGRYNTPTIKGYISSTATPKKIKNECEKTLKNLLKTLNYYGDTDKLKSIGARIKNEPDLKARILQDMEAAATQAFEGRKKVNFIISVGVQSGNQQAAYTDDEEISREVLKKVLDSLKFGDLSKQELHCSSCGKKTQVLTISGKPWAFFTLDKPSYRNNSAFREASQFPICPACAVLLEIGRCYVENELQFRLATYDFYLVPRLVIETDRFAKSILTIKGEYMASTENLQDYSEQEDRLLRTLARKGNGITYDLLFYETQQAKFVVKMHIRDVTPSQISRVHKALAKIRNRNKLRFDFWSIRNMLIQRNDPSDAEVAAFLELLDAIFTGQEISRRELQKNYLRNHKTKVFASDSNSNQSSLHFFYTTAMRDFMDFLEELGQLGR